MLPLVDQDEIEVAAHQPCAPDIIDHPEDTAISQVDHPQLKPLLWSQQRV
jgi:hypothetical protein